MRDEQFQEMEMVEETHFWHKARREIIDAVLKKNALLNQNASVLEIGAATGANIRYFKHNFKVIKGVELNSEAIDIAKVKSPEIEIITGFLPDNIGYGDEKFDLIFLFDVLEHVENDHAALVQIKKRLTKGGHLVLTVPAYQFLFGVHDEQLYHFRRYNIYNLAKALKNSGFEIKFKSYFNFWLFPLVLVSRLLEKISKKSSGYVARDDSSPFASKILYGIMRSEKYLLSLGIKLPFGSSVIMVAK